jgi:hypothetical protein
MNELMAAVERAVRPVRAGFARKMRMRQELLAHLTASYEEERARLGDDRAAVAEALRRFGDPKEVGRDLQASVPLPERVLHVPVPGLGRGGAASVAVRRFVGRLDHPATIASLWAVFTVACNVPLAWLRFNAGSRDAAEAWVYAGGLAALGLLSFAFMWCFCRTCQALSGTADRRRAVAYGALAAGFLIATIPVQLRLLLGPGEISPERLVRGGIMSVLVVSAMAWVAAFTARRRDWAGEWARLEVGE